MSRQNRTTFGAIGLVLGLVALMLILILTAVHTVGTDADLYFKLQAKYGVLSDAGVTEGELKDIDQRMARYLLGDVGPLTENPPFNDREMAHMADCLRLFALLRKVRSRLVPWAVLLIVGGAYLLQDRRRARRCAWLAPLVLLIPLGGLAIWACADFDGAFTFIHRVLFDNDLWLLDERTDLLIRICPEEMFAAMGLRIALSSGLAMAGVTALAVLLTYIWPKMKGNGGDTWNGNRVTRRAAAQRPKTFDVGGKR
jgi:integral membrane protein (TIGR01906 family)